MRLLTQWLVYSFFLYTKKKSDWLERSVHARKRTNCARLLVLKIIKVFCTFLNVCVCAWAGGQAENGTIIIRINGENVFKWTSCVHCTKVRFVFFFVCVCVSAYVLPCNKHIYRVMMPITDSERGLTFFSPSSRYLQRFSQCAQDGPQWMDGRIYCLHFGLSPEHSIAIIDSTLVDIYRFAGLYSFFVPFFKRSPAITNGNLLFVPLNASFVAWEYVSIFYRMRIENEKSA